MFDVNIKYDQVNEKIYFKCADAPCFMLLGSIFNKNKLNPNTKDENLILSLPANSFSNFEEITNLLKVFNLTFDLETSVSKYREEEESRLLNELANPNASDSLDQIAERLSNLKMDSKGLLEEYFEHNKANEPRFSR